MTPIRSHQWLALDPVGDEARDSRALRPEERDILTALSAGPVRMVDLFRRLRLTDSTQFQELLARGVGRGWLQVHNDDPRQAPVPSAFAVDTSSDTPVDPALALEQLLARYQADPVVEPLAPAEPLPVSAPLPEPPPVSLVPPPVESGSAPVPSPARSVPPPRVVDGPEDDWMAAMGVSPVALPTSPVPRSAAPAPSDELPVSAAHAELLRALANTPPSAIDRPAVKVPAYGLGETLKPPSAEDPGFVRLKDVGAVRGPGDGPLSGPSGSGSVAPSAAVPAPPAQTTPSARSRRQNNGREQFLAATRRQAVDRENARLLAQRNKQDQAERQMRHDDVVEQQRKVEATARRPSLREHAERARRIRDGLPPES